MIVKHWRTTRDGFLEGRADVATRNGVYELNGVPFRMVAGSPLPPGAVIRPEAKADAAPENKSVRRRTKAKDAE